VPLPDPKDPKPKNPANGDPEASQQEVMKFAKEQPLNTSVMPTMLGIGYGTYQQRPENFLLSFVTHTAALGLMLWVLHLTVPAKIIPPTTANSVELAPYVPMKVGKRRPQRRWWRRCQQTKGVRWYASQSGQTAIHSANCFGSTKE